MALRKQKSGGSRVCDIRGCSGSCYWILQKEDGTVWGVYPTRQEAVVDLEFRNFPESVIEKCLEHRLKTFSREE